MRLEVLECLPDGEKCVCEIIDKLKKYEQAHISKSLIKLKEAGILKDRKKRAKRILQPFYGMH